MPRAEIETSTQPVHDHLTKGLTELEAKEDNLLDLVGRWGAVAAKVRGRLMAIVEHPGTPSKQEEPRPPTGVTTSNTSDTR